MDKIFSAITYCQHNIPDFKKVETKVRGCPTVGSLKSVNDALTKLTFQSNSSVGEIAEVIGRDISLTARLLRLVNSVFSGLSVTITSIDEAIFFLGLRQIRQLAMTTKVIEEMDSFVNESIDVNSLTIWRHSIATAILTREILTMTHGVKEDDTYYIAGLLHDIGKLVMVSAYPQCLKQSLEFEETNPRAFLERERKTFGFTHADLGAVYVEQNGLSPEIVEAVLFHHEPEKIFHDPNYAAGVEVADILARYAGCDAGFEPAAKLSFGEWEEFDGWKILFAGDRSGNHYARASIHRSIENLPSILKGLL
ncbi:MAG: HDOD domain-containing protein [Verrucomicrobia bacterium]|nr:HDOD domain-containing protein [Verrucomicrobiota bacterium]